MHRWLDKTAKPRTYKVTKGKYNKVVRGVFSSTHYLNFDEMGQNDSKKSKDNKKLC